MIKKLLLFFLTLLILFFTSFYFSPYINVWLLDLGLMEEKIPIAGTGSMYPTFPKIEGVTEISAAEQTVALPQMRRFTKGINIFGFNLFAYQLQRGDIVEFSNDITDKITQEKYGEKAGFVKRVVALEGDTVEMRDGFLYLNGKLAQEPYTAKPRSTYGGDVVPDCQKNIVPEGKVFALGDNRKASLDSRFEIGFVETDNIQHVLPISEQKQYQGLWRDPSVDQTLAHTPTLDSRQFVSLLNDKRKEKNLALLNFNLQLSNSAKRRGETMIKFNDFSTDATKSGFTLGKAIKESSYYNIVFAELFTRGFYEAEELIENLMEFPDSIKFLLSTEYQDIGLSTVLGDVDNCPTQVIVLHLGGYKPPNYKSEVIESWKKLLDNINEVLPSWEALKGEEKIDQNKLDRLLNILYERRNNAQKIYDRMKRNEWLTSEEEKLAERDKELNNEAEKIVEELSGE